MTSQVEQPETGRVPLTRIQRTIAQRMTAAWAAPVFHLGREVDMTAAIAGRAPKVTVTDVLLRAAAASLRRHPGINAHFDDGALLTLPEINIGVAVATDAGLIVPVIRRVDTLSLTEIAAARTELVTKAREGALKVADLSDGSFTVSNLGMLGIDRFDAILNIPQVAILAVGRTVTRPWFNGAPAWRPTAEMTLTCDHRAVDGAAGAAWLASFAAEVEGGGGEAG